MTGLAYAQGGSNLFTAYSWTYDSLSSPGLAGGGVGVAADGRVSAIAASPTITGPGRVTQMAGQDGTSDYGYDATSQLTSATHTFQTNESYTYDANGNRTMTGWQTGTDNRLLNDGTYTYEYDKEGNRTKRTKTATGDVTEYAWDYRNRLVKVTEKDMLGTTTKVVEYTYDVFNRRIAKEVDITSPFDMQDAVVERYLYDDIHNGVASADGGNVVLDFVDADGPGGPGQMAMAKRYLWGQQVDQLLSQEDVPKNVTATDRVLWPVVDHLQTVRDLVKQDGTVATHFVYDAYGQVISGDTSLTRYFFTSRELDTDTGLQYNRARWYDAAVGRWISEDPLGFVAGDGNVIRYVGNGVTFGRDPSGEWVWPWDPHAQWWWPFRPRPGWPNERDRSGDFAFGGNGITAEISSPSTPEQRGRATIAAGCTVAVCEAISVTPAIIGAVGAPATGVAGVAEAAIVDEHVASLERLLAEVEVEAEALHQEAMAIQQEIIDLLPRDDLPTEMFFEDLEAIADESMQEILAGKFDAMAELSDKADMLDKRIIELSQTIAEAKSNGQ